MPDAPNLYDITISFNDDDENRATTDALLDAFSGDGPFLARPMSLAREGGDLSIRFGGVSDDPTFGPTSVNERAAGAEIVAGLQGFSREHSATVATIKTLLSFAALREAAGLPPRRELHIDVRLAEPFHEDAVSTHRSEIPRTTSR